MQLPYKERSTVVLALGIQKIGKKLRACNRNPGVSSLHEKSLGPFPLRKSSQTPKHHENYPLFYPLHGSYEQCPDR